ncbi:MAG: lipoprotein chaperone [Lentisphaerae bacterium ADurb.Bin082]|nr:MAG: lipoprotein chaperone [Lentisphaerae bacterium ADurb.Bin082]
MPVGCIMRRCAPVALALALTLLAPMAAAENAKPAAPPFPDLDRLKKSVIPVQTLQADFTQTRTLAELGMELTFTGRIVMEKQGRLGWFVHTPLAYACILGNGRLVQWDGESNQVLTLSERQVPWLKALQESLGNWLGADVDAIFQDFTLIGGSEKSISLAPKTPFLQDFIKTLVLSFTPDFTQVDNILLLEVNGDSMLIQFNHPVLNQPIPEDTWQVPPKPRQP